MMVYQHIQTLLNYALAQQLIEPSDLIYARHRLMSLLHLAFFEPPSSIETVALGQIQSVLDALFAYAVEQHVVAHDDAITHDLFDTALMDCLMPRPSQVQAQFKALHQTAPQAATEYFYQQSRASNYIRMARIAHNIGWSIESSFGHLDITINLSKPEIDPRHIAQARLAPSDGYPTCLLCRENEGYAGRLHHPARHNLRLIPLELNQEDWFLQYSPYEYYNEHCIVLKAEHEPMHITSATIRRLLDFVQFLPHYFIGSNADLPIVGGSILSHEHFQGGRYRFAMQEARAWQSQELAPHVELQLLHWPLSVLRLRSIHIDNLLTSAQRILKAWRDYSDDEHGIRAFTQDTPHNTVTLIARQNNGAFELDMVLRNNRVDAIHPHGIFHPHEGLHHIKKENIGLIEVMGLAILPARIWPAALHMADCLQYHTALSIEYAAHQAWFSTIAANYTSDIAPLDYVKQHIGQVFEQVLCCAGVFKATPAGRLAFERFIATI
ncbi:MAG: UDP-glucose--hexose-1-phosphate uridylyltransferase [Formosimonas sp.]